MAIRILLVDDHALVREGMRSLLAADRDFEVVGEAADGRAALELLEKIEPDVVALDVAMPGMNGIEAMRRIRDDRPRTRVLALSMHGDDQYVGEMLKAGAVGYVLKNSDFEEIAHAIRRVHAGEVYISSRLMSSVVEGYVRGLRHGAPAGDDLTDKEREVLQLLAEGKAAKEVAAELHVSVKTVQTHRQHIMDKLELYSLAELTKYAIRRGMTTLD